MTVLDKSPGGERDAAIAYLDSHIGLGVNPGLERISGLLEMMGDPQTSYPIIHIAGTNGKTSVARMATVLLVAHGITTGTFVSPHLERIEERFSLNGVPASPEQFAQAVTDIKAFADIYEARSTDRLTYFELTAALALSWFADEAVGAAIVEVGLGGRLDATNVVNAEVAVLTEVGIEHTEFLGDTIEAIATEKLAIVEPGSTLITGPIQPSIDDMVVAIGRDRDVTVHSYGKDFRIAAARRAVSGWRVDVEGIHETYEDLYLPIHGRHQTLNLAVAIAAVEALHGRALDDDAVTDATQVMSSPGRMEPVGVDPLVLLDGAHNADGFAVLAAALEEEFPTTKWVLVTGAMRDKDLAEMYPRLAKVISTVIVTESGAEGAWRAEELAERLETMLDIPIETDRNPVAAFERARRVAGGAGAVLVAGSLYLVGAVRAALSGDRPDRNER